MTFSTSQKLAAEALGTAFLLAIVVGSGIMGETLAGGNIAIALLGNTIATGAGLYVLITILGPVSGAHFNPAVTFAFLLRGDIKTMLAVAYIVVQLIGGIIGVWATHLMFELDIVQSSQKDRGSIGEGFGEAIATFGLILTIFGAIKFRADAVALCVGLYITAGYWFTSSTSFANPAVTVARTLSDSFAGIAPANAPGFIIAQFIGAMLAVALAGWLFTAAPTSHHREGEHKKVNAAIRS